jgi:hypothetical protein
MEENNKYLVYCIILIPIFFYIILPIFNTKNIIYNPIHVIITRYREPDLTKLLEPFINNKNISIFIYNKGDDIPLGIPDNSYNITIINIPNLGWDSYGYITHVINNYNNLPTYIVNIHASAPYNEYKNITYIEIIDLIYNIIDEKNDKIMFYGGTMNDTLLDFRLYDWKATLNINNDSNDKYILSQIYPLNKWLESKIQKIPDNLIIKENYLICNYFGQFLVHKSKILKYDISFYNDILNEISVWQSEVNHYLERSWYTFYGEY